MKQKNNIMRYKHHQRVAISNPISHSREREKKTIVRGLRERNGKLNEITT